MPDPKPSRTQQETLMQRILDDQVSQAKVVKTLIRFFFQRSLAGEDKPLTRAEIVTQFQISEIELRRTREKIDEYFENHSEEPIGVELLRGSYLLRFFVNRPRNENLKTFWQPYFNPFIPTLLYFTEPQFYKHSPTGTYVRHPSAFWRGHGPSKTILSQKVGVREEDLIPSYSFVPSGITAAMARLSECFHFHGADMTADRLFSNAHGIPSAPGNVVVLGSPSTSLPLLNSQDCELSTRTVMRSHWEDGTCRNTFIRLDPSTGHQLEAHVDDEEFGAHHRPVSLTKWAILTRRCHRPHRNAPPRFVTVLSGHSRSVHAVAELITKDDTVELLLAEFKGKNGSPPEEWQVLLRCPMEKYEGELTYQQPEIIAAEMLR